MSENEPSNPKVFKLFTSDLKNNSHLYAPGEAKWKPKNQIVFKLFTSRLEKQLSLIPTERQQMHTQPVKYFQTIYNPPQEKLQNKKAVT